MPSLADDPRFSANAFFPRRDSSPKPPNAIDLMLAVDDETRVHARIHDAPSAIATLVLFHGNGEVVADYDALARSYEDAGAKLVVVDYRGYGRSDGRPNVRTTIEDAPRVISALKPHLDALPVIVMGRSLGSMCAAELMREAPLSIAGFVLESGFTDVLAFARRRGIVLDTMEDDDRALLCPLAKIARSRAPLLVLHGEDDTLIVPNEGRAAFAASTASDKTLVIVPGRGHNDLSFHPVYWGALASFVARVAATR